MVTASWHLWAVRKGEKQTAAALSTLTSLHVSLYACEPANGNQAMGLSANGNQAMGLSANGNPAMGLSANGNQAMGLSANWNPAMGLLANGNQAIGIRSQL